MSRNTFEDAIKILKDEYHGIPDYRVETALRLMKVRHIRKECVERMKACVALHNNGLKITGGLVSNIVDSKYSVLLTLHNLGDKKCLIYLRKDSGVLMWIVNPLFLKYLERVA